ncbi:MAG: hypothetical protein ACR2HC_06415 [Thermoleophilaceae bacterium]
MDRKTILWTLTAFFGATVAFGLVRGLTDGQPAGVTLGIQLLVLAAIIGAILMVQRRQG